MTTDDLRAALLADLDQLLAVRFFVSGDQKTRLRACRSVIAADDATVALILAAMSQPTAGPESGEGR